MFISDYRICRRFRHNVSSKQNRKELEIEDRDGSEARTRTGIVPVKNGKELALYVKELGPDLLRALGLADKAFGKICYCFCSCSGYLYSSFGLGLWKGRNSQPLEGIELFHVYTAFLDVSAPCNVYNLMAET
ncbi:hypothetical protein Q3G72_007841 [Acer saccharum]|nr:hypothetical protein Q3G72_007841 [Acer saccharum]